MPGRAAASPYGSLATPTSAGGEPEAVWSPGYALVVLDDGADLQAARRAVQARGGKVALLLPPRYLTGWIPPALDARLVGRAGIRAIYRDGGDLPQGVGPAEQAALGFFRHAARGELDVGAVTPVFDAPAGDAAAPRRPDGWERGPVSESEIAANLRQLGIRLQDRSLDPLSQKSGTASLAANSDFMTGTVSVTLFFVESDGSGTDPDQFDWTSSAEQTAFADVAAALSWWAAEAQKRAGCWVVFRLQAYFATQDPRCAQWREPTLHPSSDYALTVQEVLGNFGYTVGNHIARASAFDAAMRIHYQTDWAYAAFIAANPSGPQEFTDGYAAWSYIGGPYISMLQRSFSWSVKQVFAHESGHIFRACDEYYTPGYGGCSGCGACADTGVDNGNCEECNPFPVSCMMRSNTWALCNWTAGQIGWWRTPCTQYQFPAPRIDTVQPSATVQGVDVDIAVHGDFFAGGSTLDFGSEITVLSQNVVSDSLMQARIRVPLDASPGRRDVQVRGPDAQTDILADGLEVRATPRHYVAAAGSATYPYDRPDEAAADLATVIAACSRGDTICVAGGVFAPFTLDRDLVVLGGWAGDFGARTPETTPSIVDAGGTGPAVVLAGIGTAPVLDGLVLRGGRAEVLSTGWLEPQPAGGALQVIDAAPILTDCILESSVAGDANGPGVGGGGFFWRASPHLVRCTVRGNRATRGAGLYFLQSIARLEDVRIESNDGRGAGSGAGIAALGGRLALSGGSVHANFGAQDGGGLHLEAVDLVRLVRTSIDDNAAGRAGGGIASRGSRLEILGTRLTRNRAGERGGGLDADGDSLALEGCVVAANSASALGGGLHLKGCAAWLRNLTVANNDGGPASGILWSYAASTGTIRDCIVAGNALGGFVLAGGPPPALDWNLFGMNGGLDRVGGIRGAHELDGDPHFVAPEELDFRLALESPAIDSGDPYANRPDPDGSPNDRGGHGGPQAWPAAPARIGELRALRTDSSVDLQWSASPAPDVATYVVYCDSLAAFRPSASNRAGTVAAPASRWSDPNPRIGGRYRVVAVDVAGHASGASIEAVPGLPSDATSGSHAIALHRIAPNPANPGAWIEYEIPSSGDAQLAIFNARGARVRVLQAGFAARGGRRIYWDGVDDDGAPVASGVYWVRLVAGGEHRTRKLVVVR